MAKLKKAKDVAKFGGVDGLGTVKLDGFDHEASSIEVESGTKFESDEGHGDAVVIRCFTFSIDPTFFLLVKPDKQQIFNSHYKGIETSLWKDGWKVYPEIDPRVAIEPEKMSYTIYVAAKRMKGHLLREEPLTLSEAING